VYPPVDTDYFQPPSGSPTRERSALIVSALVPYKRLDVAIAAARLAGVRLTIVGRGPEEARLRQIAGDSAEFLGWASQEQIRTLYQSAAVVLLPGVEDFGIVPVEAQACGTPVVALGRGGACETVQDDVTGALVKDGPEGLAEGITRVLDARLDASVIRRHAERFSRANFRQSFIAAVADVTGTAA
jgi:glycosyltransferase involved in cell wall biosynthesis